MTVTGALLFRHALLPIFSFYSHRFGRLHKIWDILLAEHGISCEGKTARQLIPADYDRFDLLIGMDRANRWNMHRICGGDFANKLHLLMDYTDRPGDVADPWYTDDFETTWRDVLEGCTSLLDRLK